MRFDRFTAEQGALKAVPLPGTRDAIAALHAGGFLLGVATNDSTGGAEKTLLAIGIAQMFVAAYGYDAVANPKPAPDTVRAFCDLTGLKASQVAMVGDNRHDLEMARAGGCGLAVGVLSGTGTAETLTPMADIVLRLHRRPAGISGGEIGQTFSTLLLERCAQRLRPTSPLWGGRDEVAGGGAGRAVSLEAPQTTA